MNRSALRVAAVLCIGGLTVLVYHLHGSPRKYAVACPSVVAAWDFDIDGVCFREAPDNHSVWEVSIDGHLYRRIWNANVPWVDREGRPLSATEEKRIWDALAKDRARRTSYDPWGKKP